MITISKQSKTYKFYNFLSNVFIFRSVTPFSRGWRNYGEMETFRDICTFARVTLLYIFFSLPIFITFFASILYTIYSILLSLFTLEMNPSSSVVLVVTSVVLGLAAICFTALGFVYLINKATNKVGDNTLISLVKESIVSKHNKFCQVLKVVDEKEIEDKKE